MQHTATHCNTLLQHPATPCNLYIYIYKHREQGCRDEYGHFCDIYNAANGTCSSTQGLCSQLNTTLLLKTSDGSLTCPHTCQQVVLDTRMHTHAYTHAHTHTRTNTHTHTQTHTHTHTQTHTHTHTQPHVHLHALSLSLSHTHTHTHTHTRPRTHT